MILLACQIGGLGALTMTSLLALAIGRKMGLRSKLIAQEELSIGRLGEVGSVLRTVAYTSIGIESTIALVLTPRFLLLGENLPTSLWHGIFYAISSFNNAGFTPHSDGLVPYGHDFFRARTREYRRVLGGTRGSPCSMTIQQKPFRPRDWTLTTKLTVTTTSILFVLGALLWGIAEWANPRTIGNYGAGEKILSSIFASIMTRSGGFNLVDMNDIRPVHRPHNRCAHVYRRRLSIYRRRRESHHDCRDYACNYCGGTRRPIRDDFRAHNPGVGAAHRHFGDDDEYRNCARWAPEFCWR